MKITAEIITENFNYLYEDLDGIPQQNIFNYDETNFADNPLNKKCNFGCSLCRIGKKMDCSKQAFYMIFCGSGAADFSFLMIVYKMQYCY